MISVCIPVYNCDITALVRSLINFSNELSVEYEVVIIDDDSFAEYKQINRSVRDLAKVLYVELEKNVGRSAIRNLFLERTKYEKLLFLDSDTDIANPRFISNYLIHSSKTIDVICGGRIYPSKPIEPKRILRWRYGVEREFKMARERNRKPYNSFMTNNFLIKRDVLEAIKFDEKLKGYGHEDSLFGFQLMKNDFYILHIDNPTIHDFNETSDEFLEKTRNGIENLLFIHTRLVPNGEFIEVNKLLKTFEETKRIRSLLSLFSYPLLPFFAALFRVGIVPLWCFDAYKLLYLCRISKTTTNHLA